MKHQMHKTEKTFLVYSLEAQLAQIRALRDCFFPLLGNNTDDNAYLRSQFNGVADRLDVLVSHIRNTDIE